MLLQSPTPMASCCRAAVVICDGGHCPILGVARRGHCVEARRNSHWHSPGGNRGFRNTQALHCLVMDDRRYRKPWDLEVWVVDEDQAGKVSL
jgi:hypothetical protein